MDGEAIIIPDEDDQIWIMGNEMREEKSSQKRYQEDRIAMPSQYLMKENW